MSRAPGQRLPKDKRLADAAEAARLYVEEGLSTIEVGKRLDPPRSVGAVWNLLKLAGVETRPRGTQGEHPRRSAADTVPLTALVIARGLTAAALAYGDDPAAALMAKPSAVRRRSLAPAAHGIAQATGCTIERICGLIGISSGGARVIKAKNRPGFSEAMEAARLAVLEPERALAPIATKAVSPPEDAICELRAFAVRARAQEPARAIAVPPSLEEAVPRLRAALPELFAANPQGVSCEHMVAATGLDANSCRKAAALLYVAHEARWVRCGDRGRKLLFPWRLSAPSTPEPAPPLRIPVEFDEPELPVAPAPKRPAPAARPTEPRQRTRAIPRGARIEPITAGVSVIRMKPVTPRIARWSAAYVARGVAVDELADLFGVSADALSQALAIQGRAA